MKIDTNLDKINLDLTTPRIRAAMHNLGIKPLDLKLKQLEDFTLAGVLPDIAAIRYEAHRKNFVKLVNKVLFERKRIIIEGP